ncbi:MAG: hypothetical protein JWQ63_1769 [Mucilaginibacter sp.]|nr:hypothetical protein [Mucilaginibacter sp.]
MYFYIGLILLTLSIIESLFKYEIGIKRILLIFSISLFFILVAFNTWSPDLDSYKLQYQNYDEQYVKYSVEPATLFIMKYANIFGFTFEQYQIFIAFIIFLLLYKSLVKYSPLPVFILSCFYIIPFFPNIVQVRSFLSYSILIYALRFLNNQKIKFWMLFLVAFFIHYSVLVFLPFIFLKRFPFYNSVKKNHYIILIGTLLLLLVPKSISEPVLIFINPKYLQNLKNSNTFLGTLTLFMPFYIINYFVLSFHERKYKFIEYKIDEKYKSYIPLLVQLIQYSNYTIIFQYFLRDTSRITYILYLATLIYLSIILFYGVSKKYNKKKVTFLRVTVLLWTILIFYVNFLMINLGEYFKIIERVFDSNSIFK